MVASTLEYQLLGGFMVGSLPLLVKHPGQVFWCGYDNVADTTITIPGGVLAEDASTQGGYLTPFKTLDYAIGQCTANRGDIIVLFPGHTEAVTGAGTITHDVAGVATVGLGTGSEMAQIESTAAASTHVISAANNTFVNVNWEASFADITKGLDVSGVDGLTWQSCKFTEEAADLNYVDCIVLATGADRIAWYDCEFISNDVSIDGFVTGVAHDDWVMMNCSFASNAAQGTAHGLVDASGHVTNVIMDACWFQSAKDGALWVDFNGTACGGLITNCWVSSIDTAGFQNTLDFTGGHALNCEMAGDADGWGIIGGGTGVYVDA